MKAWGHDNVYYVTLTMAFDPACLALLPLLPLLRYNHQSAGITIWQRSLRLRNQLWFISLALLPAAEGMHSGQFWRRRWIIDWKTKNWPNHCSIKYFLNMILCSRYKSYQQSKNEIRFSIKFRSQNCKQELWKIQVSSTERLFW